MLKFLVFADFHYRKRMYAVKVEHLQQIMDRAKAENVDFVIHAGDFSNGYRESPEIIEPFINNSYGLPVYGIYGNHELEHKDDDMDYVSPLLCNRPVVWGEQGGYWYADIKGMRVIGLDTNYSYSEERDAWEHSQSHRSPEGNVKVNSLGTQQLAWLEQVLADTASEGRKAIVFSHAALTELWEYSPDAKVVQGIFAKYPGTVLLAVNGHLHTDHFAVEDGVAYFDVNAAINGDWWPMQEHHYTEEDTFDFEDYDAEGKLVSTEKMRLKDLKQGLNTWFFETPLSAVITVEDNGKITIEGSEARWAYDIAPTRGGDGVKNCIEDRTAQL